MPSVHQCPEENPCLKGRSSKEKRTKPDPGPRVKTGYRGVETDKKSRDQRRGSGRIYNLKAFRDSGRTRIGGPIEAEVVRECAWSHGSERLESDRTGARVRYPVSQRGLRGLGHHGRRQGRGQVWTREDEGEVGDSETPTTRRTTTDDPPRVPPRPRRSPQT